MAADFSWVPPLIVLAVGAVAGATVVVVRARSRSQLAQSSGSVASDLQRQYDGLIRRLAEGVSGEERARIELQAARVLMELEGSGARASGGTEAGSPQAASTRTPPKPTSAVLGFAYGAVTMGVVGTLIYLALQGSTPRPEGGGVTGGGPMASSRSTSTDTVPETASNGQALATLEEAVRAEPRNIAQRLELTRAYLQQRDLIKVFDQTKAVLEIEPGNPRALTYQALVRVAMGQADMAEAMLLEAIKKDAQIEDAYIHLAIARIQRSNRGGAEEAIREAQRLFPQDKDDLAQMFTQLTNTADARTTNASADHPAEDAAMGAPANGSSSAALVVVVDLPKGAVVPASAILFVIVREAGFETGPPVAVKRVPAVNFPVTVTITNKDSMAGESLPGLVRIDARIDRDGNPLSKDSRDPVANEDNVRPGTGQTLLVLGPPKP